MLPAHERFHADELKGTNVNLWLVLHEKLRTLETGPQVALEHELFQRARGPTRSIKMKSVAALNFRAIEGDACGL